MAITPPPRAAQSTDPLWPLAATALADVAIVHEGGILTYAELDAAVERHAVSLSRAGAGPGAAVAIAVADPVVAVTTLLGAVRARAPFVCLDADQPRERRREILADCRPAVTVTDAPDDLPSDPSALAVMRAGAGGELSAASRPVPAPTTAELPADVFCLVYTSGSTGVPKGIVQQRSAIEQFVSWFASELGLGPGTRMLHWARLSYDAAYAEVFTALAAGASLLVPPAADRSDPVRLARFLPGSGVTHLLAVPSLAEAMAAAWADQGSELPEVRVVGLFGEQLRFGTVRNIEARLPGARLYNLYGPTECILATYHAIPRPSAEAPDTTVPIGVPIPGRHVELRDADGTVTAGPGEISVRSAYLAHGYLDRPEETARAFLGPVGAPDRVYRTGDLACRLPDGTLEFLGRLDDQVKIRGVRVELGEIEAALLREPAVAHAVVTVDNADPLAPRLVAFLEPRATRELDVAGLHARLSTVLHPAMMPTGYVEVNRMPRTRSGKADRARLAASACMAVPVKVGIGRAEPSRTERVLVDIWREVLQNPDIDVDDEFFTAGGYSMLAPRVTARIFEVLGADVPVRAVFDHPRLRDLAAHVDSDAGGRRAADSANTGER